MEVTASSKGMGNTDKTPFNIAFLLSYAKFFYKISSVEK